MKSARNKIRITSQRADNNEFSMIWFAARPSGTENMYKIYAESFRGADHLRCVLEETQTIVSNELAAVAMPERGKGRASQQTVSEANEERRHEGNPN